MTYEAEVQFKFDATYTHDYNRGLVLLLVMMTSSPKSIS